MRHAIIILAVALHAVPAKASFEVNLDRFELWTACAEIYFVVEALDEYATAFGLSEQGIEALAGSRLRAARMLGDASSEDWLYLRVTGFANSYAVEASFQKRLHDERSGLDMTATTWARAGLGVTGRKEGNHVMSMVSQFVDMFIDDYLRVNATACR